MSQLPERRKGISKISVRKGESLQEAIERARNNSKEFYDKIGEAAEYADNMAHAAELPLPTPMHVEQLRIGMRKLASDLKSAYVGLTGENPWE